MASHPKESKNAKRNGDGGWKRGPLPKDTYGWGGVVRAGEPHVSGGFYFADFQGDKVVIVGSGEKDGLILQPHEVAWFNNALTLPPAYEG